MADQSYQAMMHHKHNQVRSNVEVQTTSEVRMRCLWGTDQGASEVQAKVYPIKVPLRHIPRCLWGADLGASEIQTEAPPRCRPRCPWGAHIAWEAGIFSSYNNCTIICTTSMFFPFGWYLGCRIKHLVQPVKCSIKPKLSCEMKHSYDVFCCNCLINTDIVSTRIWQ